MHSTHEVDVAAPPAEVWRGLTEPDLVGRWYHGAVLTAEWRSGGKASFRLPDGLEMEAGAVVEFVPERRLALETRFVWADDVRAEPPHRTTWELEPAAVGTRVRLTFDVPDAATTAARYLGDEGGFALKGLRLAVDAAEQARVGRRDVVGEVEIRDVTPALLAHYQHFFDDVGFQDHPEWQGCYCGETNLLRDETRTVAATRAAMSGLVEAGQLTALLAYADGAPVAWCNYGETTRLAGVMAKLGLDAAEHDKVGSVACFVISSQYRRHGLAGRLLEVACDRLRARGCTQVEAYPPKDSASDYPNYRGPLAMYLAAGFEPYREAGRTRIVRKSLV